MAPLMMLALLAAGCASYDQVGSSPSMSRSAEEAEKDEMGAGGGDMKLLQELGYAMDGAAVADEDMAEGEPAPEAVMAPAPRPSPRPSPKSRKKADAADKSAGGKDGEAAAEEVATRSWFPESMLWEPLVETGDDGVAVLPVAVPDQLTTWRLLALAHDRDGHQAGAVHTFDGTLPVYVEPVMPGWLYAGDQLLLPVQAMNTTASDLTGRIEVAATGAMQGRGVAAVALGPGGSTVRTLPLSVEGAGAATVKATLFAGDDSDAAERMVSVRPVGRPVEGSAGGILSGERTLTLGAPTGTDPRTDRIEVLVFPGPLAVVQAELERVAAGASSPYGAYGFSVVAHARSLAATTGTELDAAMLRSLQIVAWQRVVRAARAPSTGQAADLLLALRDVEGHELAEQLRDRLVRTVVSGQRADGTYSRDATSTAQRVVVEPALAALALPPAEQGARLRAAGAIERLLPQIDDPYTASVVLASGLVGDTVAASLREQVEEALVEEDGRYRLAVPDGVRNASGGRPSLAEARAFAALALPDHDARGDLVAALMQGWSARYGFGAGAADPIALAAIAQALPGTTEPVTVTLSVDGKQVAQGPLDPTQPKLPVVLAGALGGGRGELTLTAEPEVPGLAFVATRRSWVPWRADDRVAGVDIEVSTRGLAVGRAGALVLNIAAPKGVRLTLEQGLPAGTTVDEVALAGGLGGQLTKHQAVQGRLTLTTRPFTAGEVMELTIPVTPAFGGRFTTEPLRVGVDGAPGVPMRPVVWVVASGDS